MAKNKGGRPKKEAAEKLKYKVAFMLSTGDYFALKANAKAAKLCIAEVARRAVTGCRITRPSRRHGCVISWAWATT